MRGPVFCRREVWRSPEKVVQEWSSWIVRGEINSSDSFATGNPWAEKGRPKGPLTRRLYPHGVMLPAGKERTEIRPSCLKVADEEIVWWAFMEFDMPGKVIRAEWDSPFPLMKIYDETNGQNNLRAKHTKFFLL